MRRASTILAVLAIACTVLAIACTFSVASATAARTSTFMTGIADTIYQQSPDRSLWMERTVHAGAGFILLYVGWASIATQRPAAGSDPSNPANPAYNWGTLDATVRAATQRGLTVVLSISGAPAWAEGPHRPAGVLPGTWRPNPAAAGAFAQAIARRYSGSFNAGGGTLPRVRYFQAWTEPNLPTNLTPQWVRVHRRWVAASPIIYRKLLNAMYAGVKAVHSSDVVLTAGDAPYGDPPGGNRMRPALFWRDVLCLTGRLAPAPCPNPAHFDILAHDPYSFAGPLQRPYWADDVSIADMWKLNRILAAAQRTGRALPRIHHPVWVTEFGWNSRPPDRRGIPLAMRAHWIDQAFHELWLQGVSAAAWYLIVDQPFERKVSTWQTGLYYLDGRRKPELEAFRFPFVADRRPGVGAEVWGISPDSGTLRVQALRSGRWANVLRVRIRAHGVFDRTIAVPAHTLLRAVIGPDTSNGWRG